MKIKVALLEIMHKTENKIIIVEKLEKIRLTILATATKELIVNC